MKIKTKTIQVFDCGIADHNHTTETAALRCIRQQEGKKRIAPRRATDDRLRQVLELRRAGKTFKEIGEIIDPPVSAGRAGQLYEKAWRRESNGHL